MTYPRHLIKTPASEQLTIWKPTPDSRSKMSFSGGRHTGGGGMMGGPVDFSTPAFARVSGPDQRIVSYRFISNSSNQ